MGFKDKIRAFVNAPVDRENTVDEAEDMDIRTPSYFEEPSSSYSSSDRGNKVVNIHATTQLQVVLSKPRGFEEAKSIGDSLNKKRTVVLNLEEIDAAPARRLIDFLSGVAYANGGSIKKVAVRTYIIIPYNVNITGDMLMDELESSGMIF